MTFLEKLIRWAKVRDKTVWRLFLACCLLCFGAFIAQHLQNLWERPHYQFFPCLLLVLAVFAGSRRDQIACLFASPDQKQTILRVSGVWLFVSLASLAAACLLQSPWLGFLSAFCLLMVFARNYSHLPQLALPLLILLPLPLGKDQEIVQLLQHVSSRGASSLLDIAGIQHVMAGNVLEVADRRFFVEEACSGIGSVFLLLASAAVYSVWVGQRLIVAIPFLLTSVGWAVAANMLRIFAVAASHVSNGPDLSDGLLHELLGTGTYVIAVILLLLTAQLLQFFLDPVDKKQPGQTFDQRFGQSGHLSLVHIWNRITSSDAQYVEWKTSTQKLGGWKISRSTFCLALVPMMATAATWNGWRQYEQLFGVRGPEAAADTSVAFDSLGDQQFQNVLEAASLQSFARQTRGEQEDARTFGAHSQAWQFSMSGVQLRVAVDGPFDAWHDLRACYKGLGCRMLDSDIRSFKDGTKPVATTTQAQMYSETDGHSLLLFAAFDDQGNPVTALSDFGLEGIEANITDRVLRELPVQKTIWQLQLLVPGKAPFDAAELNYWSHVFDELLQSTIEHWRKHR